jgi:hypothetical protein
MAGSTARARLVATRMGGLVAAAAFTAQVAWAQAPGMMNPSSRLRPVDAKSAGLLRAGCERSRTFRMLVERIEASDLIVHVEARHQALPGQLQFVSANPGGRYIRVSVRVLGLDDDLIPWLGHELWHAVEIAGAPEVRDRDSLRRFFERIGGGSRVGGAIEMETVKAQETQATVLGELRRGR